MSEVRSLLLLLGSAVFLAALLAGGMITYYGKDRGYQLKHVLLAPDTLTALNFEGQGQEEGRSERYVFDAVVLMNYEEDRRLWESTTLDNTAYSRFYAVIANDKSIKTDKESVENRFRNASGARLLIQVKPGKGRVDPMASTFQELQFSADGNYYRVELRNSDPEQQWAYFYHTEVWQSAQSLLKETP